MENLSRTGFAVRLLILTLAMEAFAVVMRFGFDFRTTRDTAELLGPLTGGIRIHHGYPGIVLLLALFATGKMRHPLGQRIALFSVALILSDLVHHFLVLWPLTGDHDFDLVYPAR